MGFVDNMGQPIASDVNASKVHYLGHSLGAITGINLVGLANSPLDPEIDDKFAITTNSLATLNLTHFDLICGFSMYVVAKILHLT